MNKEWLYPKDLAEAKLSQKEMVQLVSDVWDEREITHIAGMDVSFNRFDSEKMIYGSVVVLTYPDLVVVETKSASMRQEFPYIPGFLGFREAPVLCQAFAELSIIPDLLFIDGHGISHPRGLGIASQIGVLLDIPTLGVAKSILVGQAQEPMGNKAGFTAPLLWENKQIATCFRSKKNCLPLIISSGHLIDLPRAEQLVEKCLKGYRLPEPTRHAHLAANEWRKKNRAWGKNQARFNKENFV